MMPFAIESSLFHKSFYVDKPVPTLQSDIWKLLWSGDENDQVLAK